MSRPHGIVRDGFAVEDPETGVNQSWNLRAKYDRENSHADSYRADYELRSQ